MPAQPPSLASWLVDLFTPYAQAETIRGDLLEEFSEVASRRGGAVARRWYWRQSVKTIGHLSADGFRALPGLMAVSVLAAWLLDVGGNWLVRKAVVAILSRFRVYAYVDAYTFWVLHDIVVRITISMSMGYVAAAAVKGREMIAAITFSLLFGLLHGVSLLPVLRHLPEWYDYRFPRPFVAVLLVNTVVSPVLIVMGGLLCRKFRFATGRV